MKDFLVAAKTQALHFKQRGEHSLNFCIHPALWHIRSCKLANMHAYRENQRKNKAANYSLLLILTALLRYHLKGEFDATPWSCLDSKFCIFTKKKLFTFRCFAKSSCPCPTVLILVRDSPEVFLNVAWSEQKAETNVLQPSFLSRTPNCDWKALVMRESL